jgi:hypothetical protein
LKIWIQEVYDTRCVIWRQVSVVTYYGAQPLSPVQTAADNLVCNLFCYSVSMTHTSTSQGLQSPHRPSFWPWMIQSILSSSRLWSTICTLLLERMAGPCSSWRMVALEFVSSALGLGNKIGLSVCVPIRYSLCPFWCPLCNFTWSWNHMNGPKVGFIES